MWYEQLPAWVMFNCHVCRITCVRIIQIFYSPLLYSFSDEQEIAAVSSVKMFALLEAGLPTRRRQYAVGGILEKRHDVVYKIKRCRTEPLQIKCWSHSSANVNATDVPAKVQHYSKHTITSYTYTVSQKKTWCRSFCDNFVNC